jgi:hypothetical protein
MRFAGKLIVLGLAVLALSTASERVSAEAHTASGSGGEKTTTHAMAFRERAQLEMETVLGQPLRIHQDAINAAYLAVGWKWGDETPTPLDNAAYRKAWSWGFRIEVYAETRDEPFSIDELAEAPLRMDSDYSLASARTKGRTDRMLAEALASRANAPPPDWRLREVEDRVAAAEAELKRIGHDIDSLEHSARTRERKSRELRPAVDALKQSLDESEDSVGSLADELRDVGREEQEPSSTPALTAQ